jgi:hypothetical protein
VFTHRVIQCGGLDSEKEGADHVVDKHIIHQRIENPLLQCKSTNQISQDIMFGHRKSWSTASSSEFKLFPL